jgi:hypothetical protein
MNENKFPIKTARYLESIKAALYLRGIDTYGLMKQGRCLSCLSNITLDQFQTETEIETFRKTGLCVKCIRGLSRNIEGGR